MAVFAAARRVVSAQGLTASLWVTRTGCLGHCPREGCAVAVYPAGGQWVDVRAEDVDALVAHAAASNLRIR
jgi:(2Fe-2S) ferredoxin